MATVGEILDFLSAWAPLATANQDDNVGLIVGRRNIEVSGILVALDATSSVIEEAKAVGANLIVTHHPLIYRPALRRINEDTYVGRNVLTLAEQGMALISMHTNLDWAEGGVNEVLAELVGVKGLKPIEIGEEGAWVGRIGEIDSLRFIDFVKRVKKSIGAHHVRYSGDEERIVSKIGISCGGGTSLMECATGQGIDVFLSGDFKHHEAVYAAENNLCIIDAGHFETENIICAPLAKRLEKRYNNIAVTVTRLTGGIFKYE